MRRPLTASSLCFLQRNLATGTRPMDGVSTYLALIFGTLLSSQGTDASFVLTLSGFPPGASLRSCCLAFPTLSDLSDPISSGSCSVLLFAFGLFGLPAVSTLSDPFGPDSLSTGFVFPALRPFRRPRPYSLPALVPNRTESN